MQKFVRAIVSGDVQGVGYRYTVQRMAQKFKVKGFVRNLQDGTVEVQAEGEELELKHFLAAIRITDGFVQVDDVTAEFGEAKNRFDSFVIQRTPS